MSIGPTATAGIGLYRTAAGRFSIVRAAAASVRGLRLPSYSGRRLVTRSYMTIEAAAAAAAV